LFLDPVLLLLRQQQQLLLFPRSFLPSFTLHSSKFSSSRDRRHLTPKHAFLGVRGRRVTYSNYETLNTNHLGTHSQWKLDEKTWEKERSKQKAQSLKENQHQT
jgi:hypothetical protein